MISLRTPALFLLHAVMLWLFPVVPLCAQGWDAAINGYSQLPENFVAVDKKLQTLFMFQRDVSRYDATSYTCTTGQERGDKQVEGDLRTPEGIYFVEKHINKGLDWDLYGGIAYTLNYPNPMDKLRRKTGFGIWIHGRGHEITPRETQGCIALDMPDITKLGPELTSGLPVMVARAISSPGSQDVAKEDIAIARLLVQRSEKWVSSWQARSNDFFSFYAPMSYTRSGSGEFEAFKAQKKRLFRTLPWIQSLAHDVRALKGPGYWVTWFKQYYRAPNLTTEGIRRLYWIQNPKGQWQIAGMEWRSRSLDMQTIYMARVQQEAKDFLEAWRKAWLEADVAAYMRMYAQEATQGTRQGHKDIREHKEQLWQQDKAPQHITLDRLRVELHPTGLQLTMRQRYADSSGYADEGQKTLILRPEGDSWRIMQETWQR